MLKTLVFNDFVQPAPSEKRELVNFLVEHQQSPEVSKTDIEKAIDYSTEEINSYGGYTMLIKDKGSIQAAVVVNKTGTSGHIPENILVCCATHKDHRGKGLAKKLVKKAVSESKGKIGVLAGNPSSNSIDELLHEFGLPQQLPSSLFTGGENTNFNRLPFV